MLLFNDRGSVKKINTTLAVSFCFYFMNNILMYMRRYSLYKHIHIKLRKSRRKICFPANQSTYLPHLAIAMPLDLHIHISRTIAAYKSIILSAGCSSACNYFFNFKSCERLCRDNVNNMRVVV